MPKDTSDALADALGELAGKRLDRPTAHSLGKLFQKRLVGRPAWIQDGETVAILRKSTGHNENSYWVDVSAPGQAPDPPPFHRSAADTGKNIPHNPHIPRTEAAKDGKAGNVGKDGNVFRRPKGRQQHLGGRHGTAMENAAMSAIAALQAGPCRRRPAQDRR